MDPDTLLKRLDGNVKNKEHDEVYWTCRDLKDWLDKGGFEPRWDEYPIATKYYFQKFVE